MISVPHYGPKYAWEASNNFAEFDVNMDMSFTWKEFKKGGLASGSVSSVTVTCVSQTVYTIYMKPIVTVSALLNKMSI
jgi:hypothetical protein